MKTLAARLTCLGCSIVAMSSFAQGKINWNNSSNALILVNGYPVPARVSPATTYYFGLVVAPLGTPAPTSDWWGMGDTNWQFVAYGTNSTTAAGQLELQSVANVPGYAPGTAVNFIIHCWQSSSGVVDWPANQWNNISYINRSPVGTGVLGGNARPPALAFGTNAGQFNGLNLMGPCIECFPPGFQTYPTNTAVRLGGDVTLTAGANYWQFVGPPNWWEQWEAGYQWRKQGWPVPGAMSRSLILTNVTLNDAGNYDVVAYNYWGNTLGPARTVTVFIPAGAATLGSPTYNANNQFQFTVTGSAGSNYVVQVATNLLAPTTWTSVATNTSPFTFVDSNALSFQQRFYRAYPP